MYGGLVTSILLCWELSWTLEIRRHRCEFSSPDPRFMIEHLPGHFTYQISSVVSRANQELSIILNVTDLNGEFSYPAWDEDGYVFKITNTLANRTQYEDTNFNASCKTTSGLENDNLSEKEYSYCWYEGFVSLSAEKHMEEEHRYFLTNYQTMDPVCSLTIIKYRSRRAKLNGRFEYDDFLSEGSHQIVFKFKPSEDAFPRPIQVSSHLVCDGVRKINLTQITADLFSVERSIFGSSKARCQVNISNQEASTSIVVTGLHNLSFPTTLQQINDESNSGDLWLNLAIAFGAGFAICLTVAVVIIVVYCKTRTSPKLIINADNEGELKGPGENFRSVEPDTDTELIAPTSRLVPDGQTMETQFSMDQATYNNSEDRANFGPASLTENPPV